MSLIALASRLRGVIATLAALLLAACAASPFSARVTTFQQWPIDAVGQSYQWGKTADARSDTLEYRNYQDMMRAALGGIGLTEARPWERNPRFTATFDYAVQPYETWADTGPYGGPTFSYGYFGQGGPGFGWGYNMMFPFGGYAPYPQAVPVTGYRATLEVSINDNAQGGRQVFQGRAAHSGGPDPFPRVMPYLIRAVFKDFPHGDGTTRTVTIPRE